MYRSAMLTLVVFALSTTFVAADTIKGRITKIDEKSVTVNNKDAKDGKPYDLVKGCKFYRQIKDAKVEIKDGVNAEVFKNIPDKGLSAMVITNDQNKVTEITLMGKGGNEAVPVVFQAGVQARPKAEQEMPAIKVDGEWTVVYAEMDGKPADNKSFSAVTIKNNVVTCRHDGKEKSWRVEFGPHHLIRCTEQVDGKTPAPAEKGAHTHHGVYVASQEYLCVAMNKGMERRPGTAPGAAEQERNPRPGTALGQSDQAPHGAQFVLILRRAGAAPK
jgi:hypothetical protein